MTAPYGEAATDPSGSTRAVALPRSLGLPVGYLRVAAHRRPGSMKRMDEFWWVAVSSPVVHEIASRLPDINEAIRVFLVHLPAGTPT